MAAWTCHSFAFSSPAIRYDIDAMTCPRWGGVASQRRPPGQARSERPRPALGGEEPSTLLPLAAPAARLGGWMRRQPSRVGTATQTGPGGASSTRMRPVPTPLALARESALPSELLAQLARRNHPRARIIAPRPLGARLVNGKDVKQRGSGTPGDQLVSSRMPITRRPTRFLSAPGLLLVAAP